jgi:hypothetical protein
MRRSILAFGNLRLIGARRALNNTASPIEECSPWMMSIFFTAPKSGVFSSLNKRLQKERKAKSAAFFAMVSHFQKYAFRYAFFI